MLTDFILNTKQAAQILGVHTNTVKRWSREGRIQSSLTLGGHHRFSQSEISLIDVQKIKHQRK